MIIEVEMLYEYSFLAFVFFLVGESAKQNTYDPQEVMVNMKIRSVDTGLQHCIALSKQGNHVLVWGKAINGQLGVTDHYQEYHAVPQIVRGLVGLISEVSAGFNHSAALTADGAVYVWGKGMSNNLKLNARKGISICFHCFGIIFFILCVIFHPSNSF